MDQADSRILRCLVRDGRAPLRELAAAADISIPSAHARLLGLEESGVISAHNALIDPAVFGGHTVLVHGRCEQPTIDAGLQQLGADDRVFEITVGFDNTLMVWLAVRSDEDQRDAIDTLCQHANMPTPDVRISRRLWLQGQPPKLSALDAAIALTLHRRGRMPIRTIAQRVDASERRVRARLSAMRDQGVLSVGPTFDLVHTNAPFAILLGRTATARDCDTVAETCGDGLIDLYRFDDEPCMFFATLWCDNTSAIATLLDALHGLPGTLELKLLQYYKKLNFPVWVGERLIETAGR